jgi:hypothetical protein
MVAPALSESRANCLVSTSDPHCAAHPHRVCYAMSEARDVMRITFCRFGSGVFRAVAPVSYPVTCNL